jgi:beta-glucuronidase
MKAYPHFEKRKSHDLNRIWDFKFIQNIGFNEVNPASIQYDDRLPVPSAFDAFPAYAGKRGLGIYRCFVEITPDTESVLKIGGAGMSCKVYADGILLGRHIGTYTPFELTVPASSQVLREIVVVTDNRYDYDNNPLHENFFDFYNYGGIIRQVWLEELPSNPIRQVQVITDDLSTGKIKVKVEFYGAQVQLTYSIDGKNYRKTEFDKTDGHTAEFTALVPDPSPWSVETPNLHLMTIDSGGDSITVRFGIRQVKTEKGEILINGKPLKLLGYCRHEAHPHFGPATPDSLMVYDLQLLRNMGCNFVRGSHYQQDSRFLDLCDELGFVVFSESLAWGQDRKQLTDRNFINAQLEQTKAMVLTDFNHPSIIMWGFLNEGASDAEFARECYTELIKLIRSLDPSRPVTYASNRYLKDIFLEQVDIIGFNIYTGWYSPDRENECPLGEVIPKIREMLAGLEKLGLSDKPFIISEIGGAAIYGCRDPHNGFWTEEYQSELLRLVCEETVSNPGIAGLALWQFCDIRTYQGSGALLRPRGFNNKGTFDEYRRPKTACETVKSIFTSSKNKYEDSQKK